VEQVEQEQGGLQIPWNKWNKDKGSVPLNLSTDPMWKYKACNCSIVSYQQEG